MARIVRLTPQKWINLDVVVYVIDDTRGMRLGLSAGGSTPVGDGHVPYELCLDPNERAALLAYLHDQAQQAHMQPVCVFPPDAQDLPVREKDDLPF